MDKNKYILGEEVENIEQKENTTSFMMEVIRRSHDKNTYALCGEKVRNDKNFIKFMIETFDDEFEFLNPIVQEFLLTKEALRRINPENEVEYLEDLLTVLLSMSKLEVKYHGEYGYFYALSLFEHYIIVLLEIEDCYKKYGKEFLGGMWLVKELFEGNEELIDYFAKQLFNEYLKKKNINLLYMVKQSFNSYEEVEKGLKTFLFNLIKDYDETLAYHIILHESVYNEIHDFIMKSRINFNIDMIDLIYKHIDGLTHDFEAFEGVSILRGEDAIFLVLRDLNKLDDLKSYAMKNGFYDCIDIWINEYKDITIYDYDQVDINYYNYVKSLVVSIYNKKKFNLKKRNNQKIIKLSDYK